MMRSLCWLRLIAIGCVLMLGNAGDGLTVSKEKVAILHLVDGVWFFQEMASVAKANKARYATRWGYDMVTYGPEGTSGILKEVDVCPDGDEGVMKDDDGRCFVSGDAEFKIDQERAPTFGKIWLMLNACIGRNDFWLLWADADALIVNQSIPLTSIVDDMYDAMITTDWLMINAGVMLWKCSPFSLDLLRKAYSSREFDKAQALDQSALQFFLDKITKVGDHVKMLPKHAINVYTEEYRPGDFLVHMAGKLYEATVPGATAIMRQFNLLSQLDDLEHVESFFNTRVLLGPYSGQCLVEKDSTLACDQNDPRRRLLAEPLISMSVPDRRRKKNDWKDKYDFQGWDEKVKPRASTIEDDN